MRDIGSNELHRADTVTVVNPTVLRAIVGAKMLNEKEFMSYLYGGKSLEDIRHERDAERVQARKSELSKEIGILDELEGYEK